MKKLFLFLLTGFLFSKSNSQSMATAVLQALQKPVALSLEDEKLVTAFYKLHQFNLAWLPQDKWSKAEELAKEAISADNVLSGRNKSIGFFRQLNGAKIPSTAADSIALDLQITDEAIGYFKALKYGEKPPTLSYEGLVVRKDSSLLLQCLHDYLAGKPFKEIVFALEPETNEYKTARRLWRHFNQLTKEPAFREVVITSTTVDSTNRLLVRKLFQLGILDSELPLAGKLLVKKLQAAQLFFDHLNDGRLTKTTLQALNVPIRKRQEELGAAVQTLRWLEGIKQAEKLCVVNIPSASLVVYSENKVAFFSKTVVGKPATPTPTLSSRITDVVLYPYWTVPYKIATKELLPLIKRNINYLSNNGFQVLDRSGKILDPSTIKWSVLSTTNFPYTLRQSTGCDNSLGLLKFNFNNPFSVYLHDTPSKGLFSLNKRYFSHGCMRVEKPVELAKFLLQSSAAYIDSLTSQCLRDQKPKNLSLVASVPILVLYHTAWFTEKGEVRFFEDVYLKDAVSNDK